MNRNSISHISEKIPREVKYIFLLFVITRVVLTIIGVVSRLVLERFQLPYPHEFILSKCIWLDVWGLWDTGHYLNIANIWYPPIDLVGSSGALHSNYGFFPLYPILIKFTSFFLKNLFVSAIFVSNICLIITGFFLYKLVRLNDDENIALNSIKYLFLFPSAFILSAGFAESLLLMLFIMSFYYAKRENWLLAGIAGFFATLTKAQGILIFLPLFYEYAKAKEFKLKNIKINILSLLLIPLALLLFASYTYYLTGDFLAYPHIKQSLWNFQLTNPITLLYNIIHTTNITYIINTAFAIIAILLLTVFYKKIGFSYWLLGMLIIFLPLVNGVWSLHGMFRFAPTIFPFYILFAKLSKNPNLDQVLTISLALMLGFLMVIWSHGLRVII